jgi:3-deoxy-D-arabino-heptulosonate 7-phosphate (DAHP) synthase
MSLAAVASGADGLMVEVHHNPQEALSDREQALTPEEFNHLITKVRHLYDYMHGNSVPGATNDVLEEQ